MTQTSTALLALFAFWALQVVGSWVQWRHYVGALDAVKKQWNDGYVGVGRFRKRFGFGCVAVVVVAPDMRVRALRVLQGFSVFARFKEIVVGAGTEIGALPATLAQAGVGQKCLMAVDDAIVRIEEAKKKSQN
ncbi:MAG: hypothetical protein RJA36_3203 [Pseudomonadota bacterium]|jgi:glucitol operon activator protein